jgi:hypothetical protein
MRCCFRGFWRCSLLLFTNKLYDELLVFLDEIVRQALVLQILPEVLPPHWVKFVENREFG